LVSRGAETVASGAPVETRLWSTMSLSARRPPIQGRGYSGRGTIWGGGSSGAESIRGAPRAARPPLGGPGCPELARSCSIGVATRALAISVSSPIWLCHQPLHASGPCQKLVYVEL